MPIDVAGFSLFRILFFKNDNFANIVRILYHKQKQSYCQHNHPAAGVPKKTVGQKISLWPSAQSAFKAARPRGAKTRNVGRRLVAAIQQAASCWKLTLPSF